MPKLAALKQRHRTSPGKPSSLGGAEGMLVGYRSKVLKCSDQQFNDRALRMEHLVMDRNCFY
jgi:hypothetical protein